MYVSIYLHITSVFYECQGIIIDIEYNYFFILIILLNLNAIIIKKLERNVF